MFVNILFYLLKCHILFILKILKANFCKGLYTTFSFHKTHLNKKYYMNTSKNTSLPHH